MQKTLLILLCLLSNSGLFGMNACNSTCTNICATNNMYGDDLITIALRNGQNPIPVLQQMIASLDSTKPHEAIIRLQLSIELLKIKIRQREAEELAAQSKK